MAKLRNWFHKYNTWSFTKHTLWKQCKRAYYYRYIGTALWDSDEFDVDELKQLKNLDGKHVIKGKIIHDLLEEQIEAHHRQQQMNEGRTKEECVRRVEEYRKEPEKIVEYYNGEKVDEYFFDRMRTDGIDQLDMFFGVVWPQLANFAYLRHEKFDRFTIENTPAIVKVDYISKDAQGNVTISDWKTGADNEDYENSLQIGGYALWAMEYYGLRSEQITSQLVYLTTGTIRQYEFSEEELENIKGLIISDFEQMNQTYEIETFVPAPTQRKCISCQFDSICPHSLSKEGSC